MSDWKSTWGTIDWAKDDDSIIKKIHNLVEQGATMDTVDENGDTLLMYAIKNVNLNVFNEILTYPQNLNAQNKWKRTALIRAASIGNASMVKQLLVKKANPDIQDEDGMTAAITAAINDSPEMLHDLKRANANFEVKDNTDWTPLMWAISSESLKAIEELMSYKVSTAGVKEWMDTVHISNTPFSGRALFENIIKNSKRKAELMKKCVRLNGGR